MSEKPSPLPRYAKLVIAAIVLASLFLRFYQLDAIQEKIFDEVYFPVFAHNYLTQTEFYDAHPPLGKLIIAASIALFGNNPFGWRFINAVAGMLLLWIVYGFTHSLTKRWQAATLALFFVAIDPMALIESRVGLINIYLALFSLGGLWAFWSWWTAPKQQLHMLATALLCFGLAISVKWIGIGAFIAAVIFLIMAALAKLNPTKMKQLTKIDAIMLLLIIPVVYAASFIPDLLRGQDFMWWHKSTYGYHSGLTATHPYGSAWWSWPFMLRPIWLYYKGIGDGTILGIIELGNLVTWITGIAAAIFYVWRLISELAQRHTLEYQRTVYLILSYVVLYLPWAVISRVKFIYHYFLPALVLLIILALVLDEYILADKRSRWIGIIIIGLGFAFFAYYLPLFLGLPLSEESYRQHMWSRNWI